MTGNDLVSVITPAYNAEKYIGETIESVITQTYQNLEMIIVNDCSTDKTLEVIKKYASRDSRIKIINLKQNKGAANAWNVAIKAKKGRYLAFIDADDLWVAEKLEKQIKFMSENNYSFTFGDYDWINEVSLPLNKRISTSKEKNLSSLLKNTNIGTLTVMIDCNQINIPEIKCVRIDWDFLMWATILGNGNKGYGYNEVLGHYRILSNSVSRNKKKVAMFMYGLLKNEFKIPFIKRIYYFSNYIFNSVRRHIL